MSGMYDTMELVDPIAEPWERLGPNLQNREIAIIDHHHQTLAEAHLELLADVAAFPAGYAREDEPSLLLGQRSGGGTHLVFTNPGHAPMSCDLTAAQTAALYVSVRRALDSAQQVDLGDRYIKSELPWRGLRAKRIDDAGDHIVVQCRFFRGDHCEVVLSRAETERLAAQVTQPQAA